ncbi:putative xylogalacturonan beta-1,3-xylosyltransferase [Helianthus anomalus]
MDKSLQESLVKYLERRDEWRRLGGKDHLIMAHHPNSMLLARKHFGSSMLLLADFGRYPVQIANVDKDVIAPYKHVVRRLDAHDSPSFEERRLLVYFQGAIFRKDGGIIRRKVYQLIKDEKDVHFTYGSASSAGIRTASRGMISSKFCLTIAGDTPSSNRLFDAIASHCVPVIISDDIDLPFEDVLDYSKFAVFVQSSDAVKKGYLMKLLRGIKRQKWIQMWERLKKIARHFEYQYPSQAGDAVDMIWQAVHRKICWAHGNGVRRRRNRYRMSQRSLNS